MAQALVATRARLPMPADLTEFDERKWRVLCEAVFPSAKTPEAIVMALDYCKARNLDVFRKPVHIVPMWNSTLRREVETIWPGINEVQVTASRTGHYAGMDEPRWGPDITRTFKGKVKDGNDWKQIEATVTFPEYVSVTVYRMVESQRCPFTEPVYWLEAYSRAFGTEMPTSMWIKRPRGQLHKVGKAASLRTAFPEEGEYTAEEMEGKEIEAGGIAIEQPATRLAPPSPPPAPKPNGNGTHIVPNAADRALSEAEERALDRQSMRDMAHETPEHDAETGEIVEETVARWEKWGTLAIDAFAKAKTAAALSNLLQRNSGPLENCKENAPSVYDRVISAYRKRAGDLSPPAIDATALT